ncbi:hypothetical protein IC582_009952 [Cucumis melo]|uniref:poly(A)-specific ribonuclease n=3 Tax=Cucumis melo TaxID=3656 RepID=A0A5D3B887_CUCMM|nr:probable CCR4-associated factor 1 homolog 11 [Cucumis melo]KAA0061726.1 putative CCR4-associated factor 1-like protein 11 [Cucumis melo var. makuwa]TYJ96062.1 putative CCR4-associated factor 1-like protein 11 [Cucumis melo var. makuwa]
MLIQTRQVWDLNLLHEFNLITQLLHRYPFISIDTEFPGVLIRPTLHRHPLHPSDHYLLLKSNVDALNLIQLGLTLSDADGNLPTLGTKNSFIWEFNFRDFDVARHPHNPASIELLKQQGIDFHRNRTHGVCSSQFADLLMSSGLLCNNSLTWVTFHSAYDFGYLVKILTRTKLPSRLHDFLNILGKLFGNKVYDVKHMMRFCDGLYGGLDRVAKTLDLERAVGKSHQAGSDSLLTWQAFKKMRDVYFSKDGPEKHAGVLFGLEIY